MNESNNNNASGTMPPHSLSTPVSWEREMLQSMLLSTISEQRAARHWKIFFRFLWTLLIVGYIIFIMVISSGSEAPESRDHVAIVDVVGAIMADSKTQTDAENINKALREAFENNAAKAVILRINSPGGSPVQAEMVFDEVRRLRELYNKPVYAVIEDAGASAAYYIAASADDIYVSRSSLVGSIGVLTDQFGFVGLMDKLGIERRLITSGGHKGMMDPFSPMNDQDKVFMEKLLNQVHQQFISAVKEGRGDRLKIDDDTFSGLFWTGQEAIERGLADGLGTVEQVARDRVGIKRLVNYSTHIGPLEGLARQLGAGMGDVAVDALMKNGSLQLN